MATETTEERVLRLITARDAQERARMVAWLSADAAGLIFMAEALRAAGWTVAEPGAAAVWVVEEAPGEPDTEFCYPDNSEATRRNQAGKRPIVRYVRAHEEKKDR